MDARTLFLLILGFCWHGSIAQEPYPITGTYVEQSLDEFFWVYEDTTDILNPTDILADTTDARFTFRPYLSYTQPLNPAHVYWGKIRLASAVTIENGLLLFKGFNYEGSGWERGNGRIDVWEYDDTGILNHEQSGSDVPQSQKSVQANWNIGQIPFSISTESNKQLLIRIEGNSFGLPPDFGLILESPRTDRIHVGLFTTQDFTEYREYMSMVLGLITMALIYHLILFLYLREPIYGWFSVWLLFPLIANMMVHPQGYISAWFLGDVPMLRNYIWTTSAGLIWVFFWQFGRSFIGTRQKFPWIDKAIRILMTLLILNILINLFGRGFMKNQEAIYYGILGLFNLTGLVISGVLLSRQDMTARYFAGGAIIANLGVILGAIWVNDGIELSFDPFVTAIVLQIFIYSFGLAYRQNVEVKAKAAAEHRVLENEKERAQQLEQINIASDKFVPRTFLNFLGIDNILEAKLGAHVEQQVTVLFSDIRNYTSISEQMSPAENFHFVKELSERFGPIIQANQGFVHQYLGDGIMAIFPQSVEQTLDAAIAMQRELEAYNRKLTASGTAPLGMGIGMHTGPLIMGIIGDEQRMEAATISDTVNAASRVEGLTKHYGAPILLSGAAVKQLQDPSRYHLRHLGYVQVKGKQTAMSMYECFDSDSEESIRHKEATLETFERSLKLYFDREFVQAETAFRELATQYPEDQPLQVLLQNADMLKDQQVGDDWTGVELMEGK